MHDEMRYDDIQYDDVRYTRYELPIIEIELDHKTDTAKLEKININCVQVMQKLNISNITVNFKSREVIDRYIGHFSANLPGINVIARCKGTDFAYICDNYLSELKAYSDTILDVTLEDLPGLSLPVLSDYLPILQVGFCCDESIIEKVDKVIEDLTKLSNVKFVLLEPDYLQNLDFKGYNMLINKLFNVKSSIKFFLERGNLPIQILRKHPCNAYILSCASCHSGKKDLPRSFTIKSDGRVFPEGMGVDCVRFEKFVMGNIFDKNLEQLLETYRFSENHLRFKEACKRIYHDFVLDFPFGVLPWRYFYVMKAKEILSEVAYQ